MSISFTENPDFTEFNNSEFLSEEDINSIIMLSQQADSNTNVSSVFPVNIEFETLNNDIEVSLDSEYISESGGEPAQYLKDASVTGNTLTITKKNNSTVLFNNTEYTAGTNITIENNVISASGTISTEWNSISNKPFNDLDTHTLKVVNSTLAVNTANDMSGDNTRPMTAAGVNTIVGNIQVLLEGI